MPCPGPQKTQKGRFLALFLLNFPNQAQTDRSSPILADFSIGSGPESRRNPETAQRVFFRVLGVQNLQIQSRVLLPRKRKIAILARSYLGRGDLSRAQICAVDVSLRLLLLAKISAQKNQTALKYGPSKIVILGFSAIWAKISFFGLFSSNQHLTFSQPLRDSKPLPID